MCDVGFMWFFDEEIFKEYSHDTLISCDLCDKDKKSHVAKTENPVYHNTFHVINFISHELHPIACFGPLKTWSQ